MKPKAFPFICFFFVFIHTLPVSNLLALPKEKRLVIFENGTSFQARVAVSPQEQRVGLGFLPTNTKTALLFWYNSAQERIFWMKNMQFPIDIIWIYKNKVVLVEKNIPPPSLLVGDEKIPRYGYGVLADKILEIPAGEADNKKIHTGWVQFKAKKRGGSRLFIFYKSAKD